VDIYKIIVVSNTALQENVFLLKCLSSEIASKILPGQFCNIKVSESDFPLLRRPFSICDVEGDYISFMYEVHGEGTKLLSHKKEGDLIDLIGPLGKGFNYKSEYETAIFISGGIGVAPFPYLTRSLDGSIPYKIFLGGRTENQIHTYGLHNYEISTDDGSMGYKGNVVQLFEKHIPLLDKSKIKVFGCGPNPMLRALKELCLLHEINCEVSVECAMACGFGICQGCPIEKAEESDKYYLVCKDGPVFNIKDVVI
jgi:dihydroorotate dehydrogenase electron transfer subunit